MKKIHTNCRLFALLIFTILCQSADAQQQAADTVRQRTDSALALKGVTVQGRRQFIEQTAGKLTINVASSPVAAGGTAYDALMRAPGITDQQDNLQFQGKSVRVLINNRPSNLSGEELKAMLSALQASGIEKIEILSNASSAYDAQGGVVINIRLVKNKSLGTNGLINAGTGVGTFGRYNAGISLNHRTKDFNIYGSYDRADVKQFSRTSSDRSLSSDAALDENEYAILKRGSHTYKAGIDYDINKTNSLSILFRGMNSSRRKNSSNTAVADKLSSADDSTSIVNTRSRITISNPSLNVYWRSAFGSKGRELVVNGDYFSYLKDWNDDFTTRYLDGNQESFAPDYLLENNSAARIRVRALSADYTHPLSKGTIRTGLKTTFTTTDNNADWQYYTGTSWKPDAGKSNQFLFRENINAAYINYTTTFRKATIDAGLRAEQTTTNGNSKTLQQENKTSYFNLFPTLALNINASAQHQVGFSYRRSITRFGFEIVNPFISYISQYRYSKGNPMVRPGYSNSFELNHTYKQKLVTTINYSHFTDLLAPVFKKDPLTEAVISTQENLQSASQASISVTHMKMFFKGKWMMNNTVGALYAQMNDNSGANAGSKTLGAYLSHMDMFTLGKGWTAELSATYMSPVTIGVLHVKGQGSASIGVSKPVLRKNGKLTLNVSDLFNTQQQRYSVSSFGVSSDNYAKTESRVVKLVFTWKFGNKNVKAGKQRQTSIEDLKRRTEAN